MEYKFTLLNCLRLIALFFLLYHTLGLIDDEWVGDWEQSYVITLPKGNSDPYIYGIGDLPVHESVLNS